MGHREELIQRSIPFLREVKDMTPGADMEKWLNKKYGEDSELYRELSRLIKLGVEEGWAANVEVAGRNYRRSRIQDPRRDVPLQHYRRVHGQQGSPYVQGRARR